MESQQKHVIHLYEFEQQSINEKQLSAQILESLKPHIGDKNPQIKIKGHRHKYWAYFQIEPETAKKLNQMKTIKIGENTVHIGRYYYDYQIFINKLDSKITSQQVIQYFQQFGQVVDIVITDPVENKNQDFKHCYIKMKNQKTIDMVVLAKLHKIQGKEIKPVRTFGLNQYKESDKKLFLKIQGFPDNQEDFQQSAIQFFMKHGKIRERPKIQQTKNNQKYKMIVTYTNPKDAQNALAAFPNSSFYTDYQSKNINMTLNNFHTKENKIYVVSLKQNPTAVIKQAFQHFGQISQITVTKSKSNNTLTAVIGYVNQNDFKMALATYLEVPKVTALFLGKPFITIFMNAEQKRQFNDNKKKQFMSVKTNNFVPNMMPQPLQGMNPQFRMPWAPTGAPNQMMPMPQVGAMPPMGMGGMQLPMPGSFGPPQVGGQFNQPQNRVFPKQPQPPRNN